MYKSLDEGLTLEPSVSYTSYLWVIDLCLIPKDPERKLTHTETAVGRYEIFCLLFLISSLLSFANKSMAIY